MDKFETICDCPTADALVCKRNPDCRPSYCKMNKLAGFNLVPYKSSLSPRESQILALLIQGYSATEIAEELCRSVKTVSTHIFRIKQKLGIRTGAEWFRYVVGEAAKQRTPIVSNSNAGSVGSAGGNLCPKCERPFGAAGIIHSSEGCSEIGKQQ